MGRQAISAAASNSGVVHGSVGTELAAH
jgi:hypothetical protein